MDYYNIQYSPKKDYNNVQRIIKYTRKYKIYGVRYIKKNN